MAGMFDLLRMWFRKVNPTVIVRSKIMAVQAGLLDDDGLFSQKQIDSARDRNDGQGFPGVTVQQ